MSCHEKDAYKYVKEIKVIIHFLLFFPLDIYCIHVFVYHNVTYQYVNSANIELLKCSKDLLLQLHMTTL